MNDADTAPAIGHNNPPEPTPFEIFEARVAELQATGNRWATERPEITDDDMAATARDYQAQVTAEEKAAEALRRGINKPLEEQVKANNARFATPMATLAACKTMIGQRLAAYLQKVRQLQDEERRRKEAEALKARQEADRLAREAAGGKGDVIGAQVRADEARAASDAAFKAADQAARAAPVVRGQFATKAASLRTLWKFEITDPALVPREWLTVDESKIGQAVRRSANPVREIPGVRIWDEQIAV